MNQARGESVGKSCMKLPSAVLHTPLITELHKGKTSGNKKDSVGKVAGPHDHGG